MKMVKLVFFMGVVCFLSILNVAQSETRRTVKTDRAVGNTGAEVGKSKMFGMGPQLGEPFGLSAKYWFGTNPMGVQGFIGYDFTDAALALYADGLYHFKNVSEFHFPWENGAVNLYAGLGLKVSFPKKTQTVIRIPLGVNTIYSGQNWDTFAELVPGIRVAPTSGGSFDFAVGLRYYF